MKKIVSIIILSIVVLLVGATITLALIPFTQYNPVAEGYQIIAVFKNSYNNNNIYTSESAEFNDIEESYGKSFTQNLLSSMFQGALGDKTNITKTDSTTIKSVIDNSNLYFVEFDYVTEQTLMWNDEEYTYKENNVDKVAKYTSLVLEVKNTESFDEITVYVVNGNNFEFKITTLAKQAELYNVINNLSWSGANA